MVFGETVTLSTQGFSDIINISDTAEKVVGESGVKDGIVTIAVIGSTASVSTIEYEPALAADMKDRLEAFAPEEMQTRHGDTWGDDNGFSHIRATFMGPSTTLPVVDGKILRGTWQQIVVIDHDNRPRSRQIRIQVVGE